MPPPRRFRRRTGSTDLVQNACFMSGSVAAQRQERFPHLLLTSLIPIGISKRPAFFLADLDRVLQGADSLQIFLSSGFTNMRIAIHQNSGSDLVLL